MTEFGALADFPKNSIDMADCLEKSTDMAGFPMNSTDMADFGALISLIGDNGPFTLL